MRRFTDEDLTAAEFRECDLTDSRFVGVILQHVDIDGLIDDLVVNGVEVSGYVNAELDRRQPVRRLIRSDDPGDLRTAWRQLTAMWAATVDAVERSPGVEHERVDGEWSLVQTLRHLVFVHDSWFRRCCLGSTERFTAFGLGPSVEPYREAHGLDLSLEPDLAEVVAALRGQAAELTAWLTSVTPRDLEALAPVPNDDVWPPYARGRTVRACLGTVLNENAEHHRFAVRDLHLLAQRRRDHPSQP